MNLIKEINNHKYLFLESIEDSEDNSLNLIISEGKVGSEEDIEIDGTTIRGTKPVEVNDDSNFYSIHFSSYVAHSMRNEAFTTMDKEEKWEGNLFRTYTKSHFLDYVRKATFASDDFPGSLRHYEIVCEFHIIDIVTSTEPEIEKRNAGV